MRVALITALLLACTVESRANPLVERSAAWLRSRECALSCHTTVPFVMAAPSMGGEAARIAAEIAGRAGRRAIDGSSARPWYGGPRAGQSRGTEAVLNVVALAATPGRARDAAIANLWREQRADGGWDWLDFGLAPFETRDAQVYGASLAAVALSRAGVSGPGVTRLRGFLARRHRAGLALHEQLYVLWADLTLGRVLSRAERAAALGAARAARRPDGSFSVVDLGSWRRRDGSTNRADRGDAYATGLATLVLDLAGDRAGAARGRAWLRRARRADGSWFGRSLNDDNAFNRQLATDAATGFALMALAGWPGG